MTTASRWQACAVATLLVACSHTDSFTNPVSSLGPFNTGADERLTLNPNQDYWPTWTADGRGILYAFVEPDTGVQHRCLGILPAAGGTRLWQFCDNRAVEADSTNSLTAYALGTDGQLLYVEAASRAGAQSTAPDEITLWLADTAAPYQRRALLTLPGFAGTTPVSWLADIAWTDATTFTALAQDFSILAHCVYCAADDSIFGGVAVVRGTVGAGGATLQAIPGTAGATSYSIAEGGASIVFTLRNDRQLYKVPVAGGTAVVVAVVTPNTGAQLLGVSCKASTCVVADDPLVLSSGSSTFVAGGLTGFSGELRSVSLATGSVQLLRTTSIAPVATPQLSPVTGDVVAQVGGAFGHLQTLTTSASDLHLYPGLVP